MEVFHFHSCFYLLLACLARACPKVFSQQAVCKQPSPQPSPVKVCQPEPIVQFSPLWAFVALTQGHYISFEFQQLWAWAATMTNWKMNFWFIVIIVSTVNQRRSEAKNCDNYFHYDLGAVRTVASGTQLEQEIRRGKLLVFFHSIPNFLPVFVGFFSSPRKKKSSL